ncbi:amidase [Croceicoccus sediminis]|uniref:amidase n=1 Tax=Croceicoccus sediminis TaxID=2571150 RepID=UPI0011841137|nr:amidase [Croceicoccus sediminis]
MSSGPKAPSQSAILVKKLALGADGPASGPTVVVKDCIDIAGLPTMCGSRAFAQSDPAQANAAVVASLLDAGCRIVGKANMHELAYGVTGANAFTGTPVNPLFPDRIVGGSSSGSAAAVAAQMVDFSIGTDTGGSIRMPAACCNIFGLKPTFDAVSRKGAVPAQSSLDCIGLFARDMATITKAAGIIIPGFTAQAAPKAEDLVLARLDCAADGDIDSAVDGVLARSGATIRSTALDDFEAAFRAGITIMAAEMWELFGDLVGTGLLGPDIDARLAAAANVTPQAVAEAEEVRARFTAAVDGLLATCDAIVLPTLPSVPPTIEEALDPAAVVRLTELVRPFNVSGHPAISLPTRTADGLPASIQLVARKGDDAKLCAIATAIEPSL